MTVPALIWVAGFLLVDRHLHPQRPSAPGESLIYYVKESLTQVEHQIWLLRNVFWWYLLPFVVAIMAYFVHVSWISSGVWWLAILITGFMGYLLFLLYGWIYRLNQRAVREQLEPRQQDLLKLIASIEGDSSEISSDVIDMVSALVDPAQDRGLNVHWECWAENWNRLIPSWSVATAIMLSTLAGGVGAACLAQICSIPEMGPVFLQSVVGAVIAFEFSLVLVWRRSRKLRGQSLPDNRDVKASDTGVDSKTLEATQRSQLPKMPAILVIVLTVFISILAIVALGVFFRDAKSRGAKRSAISIQVTPEVSPESLVGRYQLNPNFIFDVKFIDGKMMAGITNQSTQEVFADSPTKWSYRSVDARLEFHLPAEGPAEFLTLHQNGIVQKALRIED